VESGQQCADRADWSASQAICLRFVVYMYNVNLQFFCADVPKSFQPTVLMVVLMI